MAVSGKTSTLNIRYFLGTDKPPDMAAATKAIAEDVEDELLAIHPAHIQPGSEANLLICQNTGALAYKTLKGDATIAADGTLTIGNDKITAAKIAEGAVGPTEIAAASNATVTGEELPAPTRRVHSLAAGTKTVQTIGAGLSGQLVTYVNTLTTVTFKTGGNLRLVSEFVAGVSDSITFAYVLTLSQWCEVARSNNV